MAQRKRLNNWNVCALRCAALRTMRNVQTMSHEQLNVEMVRQCKVSKVKYTSVAWMRIRTRCFKWISKFKKYAADAVGDIFEHPCLVHLCSKGRPSEADANEYLHLLAQNTIYLKKRARRPKNRGQKREARGVKREKTRRNMPNLPIGKPDAKAMEAAGTLLAMSSDSDANIEAESLDKSELLAGTNRDTFNLQAFIKCSLALRSRRTSNMQPFDKFDCEKNVEVFRSNNIVAKGKVKKTLGLRAKRDIKAGEFVCYFSGDLTSNRMPHGEDDYQLKITTARWRKQLQPDGSSKWKEIKPRYLVANNLWNFSGRYINGIFGTGKEANVKADLKKKYNAQHFDFDRRIQKYTVPIVASVDINRGEEFFLDYGNVNLAPEIIFIKTKLVGDNGYELYGTNDVVFGTVEPLSWDWFKENVENKDELIKKFQQPSLMNKWHVFKQIAVKHSYWDV